VKAGLLKLFEPCAIGQMTLENRIIMPPISTNLAGDDGKVTDRFIFHYAERARGGAALITVENVCVDYPLARHGAAEPRIDGDVFIPGLLRLTKAVHEAGSLIAVELTHPGMNARLQFTEGQTPIAPSALPRASDGLVPRQLPTEEVRTVRDRFVAAAWRAHQAGFDAVELQACHGLLINQFLSPLTNHRQDAYGASLENRCRFLAEIIAGIKRHLAEDFPVMVRLVAEDLLTGGITPREGLDIARRVEDAGADAIHPDFGLGGKEKRLEPMPYPQAWRVFLAERTKQAVSVPVIAVGVIREPRVAEQILRARKADLVALGRALIADPDWPTKARAGEEDLIRRCFGCNECVRARHVEDAPLRCSANPAVGLSEAQCRIERATEPRRVLIIGGGPAGMEAARVAALRGHHVVLYERECHLGGALAIAALPPGKEKLNWITEYYIRELARLDVDIHLGEEVDATRVRYLAPDAVVLATGSKPTIPSIDGADGPGVIAAQELLALLAEGVRTQDVHFEGRRVIIVGGGMLGLETAAHVSSQGGRATVLKRYQTIGSDIEPLYRDYLLRQLNEQGVEIITQVTVESIQEEAVRIRDESGESRMIPADRVVLARGAEPADELVGELEGFRLIVIGDALRPRKILDAIREGFETAKAI
jgi:2,4-dienoyl-CoA reductase-like NADH-dependent reductase (Old Yellow Enzyme family)/thioredoxin reductase